MLGNSIAEGFTTMQKTGESEDVLYKQFSSGYCYYFAHMLQAAFGRGEVCWAAPYGHIVWVDEGGTPYDISGVNDSDTKDYIPEYMMGKTINDFKLSSSPSTQISSPSFLFFHTNMPNFPPQKHNAIFNPKK